MKKLKKNQKGFTLVEIIVVLVILAILAGAAIPTMIGFVDDAKAKTDIANARAALVAAQTYATQDYATTGTKKLTSGADNSAVIQDLTGALTPAPTSITPTIDTKGKVTSIVYVGSTHTVTITGTTVSTEKNK